MTREEIIAMYEGGELSKADALSQLTEVVANEGPEQALRGLSEPWRTDVEAWIFEVYDNDIDSDEFVSLGNPYPDLDARRVRVEKLRRWIDRMKNQSRLPTAR
jgi:hypothetical protein